MNIALVIDTPNWALGNVARGLKKYAERFNPDLQIKLFYEFDGVSPEILQVFDEVYAFSLFQAAHLLKLGVRDYITTIHLNEAYKRSELKEAALQAKRVSVISPQLYKEWKSLRSDVVRLHVGVDPEVFYPKPYKPGVFTIGWVGKSDKSFKHYYDYVEYIAEQTNTNLRSLTWEGDDIGTIKVAPDKMVHFYNAIDCLLVMSEHEGLPTPLLEALACGVPFVSTRVGVVEEMLQFGKCGYTVDFKKIGVHQAIEVINHLKNSPSTLAELKKNAYEVSREIIWSQTVTSWIKFMTGA